MGLDEKIVQWNSTEQEVDFSCCLGEMLHNSAMMFAEHTAAVDQNGSMTYEMLDKCSNAVCNYLIGKKEHINNGIVCVMTDEIKERLCYISGILKAGMTYVPLDKKAPLGRNLDIVRNVNGNTILTDDVCRESAKKIAGSSDSLIEVFTVEQLGQMDCTYRNLHRDISETAYIIHTSGSTGVPKGVKVSERALINLCAGTRAIFDITPDDRTCMLQNVSFDYSMLDIFPFMLGGAMLYFVPAQIKSDINLLNKFMIDNGITLQPMTTALYNLFCELENPVMKKVFIAGEKMVKYIPRSYEVYNFYGPTEATVYVTYAKVEKMSENIPIGRPVINNKAIIVKPDNTIAGVGEKGELCLTGANLADGYINNEEETKKRFVPSILDTDKIMYRTGDIAEWSENGELLCYGRIDHQIKHRGYRIELDEINHNITASGLVNDSIVIYNDRVENSYIVCFYCTADNKDISSERFTAALENKLPEYMIPSRWVRLDRLPLNNNDKVDRKALLDMLMANKKKKADGVSKEERVIREIWSEMLDISSDFDADSSFHSLGGHSLISMMMLRRLKTELGVDISFVEHIGAETLNGHLELIRQKTETVLSKIKKIWCEKLDLESDFDENASFNSLGGHSILSMLMLKDVNSEFGVSISLAEFLSADTLSSFAKLVESRLDVNSGKDEDYKDNTADRYEPFMLNEMQRAYYIGRFEGMELGSIPTHLYLEIECKDFDNAKFIRVINKLFRHHEALRLRIESDSSQRVLPYYEITEDMIPVFDLRNDPDADNKFIGYRNELNNIKLDTANDSLVQVRVILMKDKPAIIQFYLDGLVADGWGQELLIRDFDILYTDEEAQLAPSPHLFRDYVNYTSDHKKLPGYDKAMEYWEKQVYNIPDAPELPLIKSPSSITRPSVSHINESITEKEWGEFDRICSEKGLTTSNVMMTVLGKVLARWCRKKDFIINLPVSNRFFSNVSFENTFGVFSDFLLFDIHDERNESFLNAAEKNQQRFYELTANRAFSGMDIIHELTKVRRNIGNAAPVVFTSLIDIPQYEANYVSKRYFQTHTSQVWFDIIVLRCGGEIQFSCDYVADLLERRTIKAIMATFTNVIRMLSCDINYWNKCDAEIISEVPISHKTAAGNTVSREYVPIMQLLDRSALKYPENIAVCTSERCYTYKELFADVRKTAAMLQDLGFKKGQTAAILMNKRYEQIVSVLAVIYCSGIYLPLDTQNSVDRICYCINESDSAFLITESKMLDKYELGNINCKIINADTEAWNENSGKYNIPDASPDDLYCIIYTSGSTGVPKGVMLPQRGLQNCIEFTNDLLSIGENDKVISLTNLCHDMSIYDIFGMLISGAGIILPDGDKVKDPVHWISLVEKYHATIWNSVPAITEMALETMEYTKSGDISSVRAIIMGGDVLQVNMPERLRKYSPNIEIYNVGGPTEATIWSIYHKVERSDEKLIRIPLGKAIDNVNYMILDHALRVCPYDTVGTIYASGVNLSKGYLRSPDKTNEKFIPDPYTGELMYNTGDIGKYRENGDIDILGREDFQIKINGKRIELGEIEAAALRNSKIDTAAAVYNSANKNICLYYKAKGCIDQNELKSELEKLLPDFMLPTVYMEIAEMPLSRNGKIDRSRLPEPDMSIVVNSSEEADNEIEKELLDMYREIIGNGSIGVNDDFFNVGGDSLKAIKLLYTISEKMGVSLVLTDIFQYCTVRTLAGHISESSGSERIIHVEPTDRMELSLAQKGMWFQVKSAGIQGASHIFLLAGSAFIPTEKFDPELFAKAVNILVKRTPELRTQIYEEDHVPYLRYADYEWIEPVRLTTDLSSEQAAAILEEKAISEIYDISGYPVFMIGSADGSDGVTAVTIGIHHIIADAYSVSRLISLIEHIYIQLQSGIESDYAAEKLCYNDFTVWQNKKLESNYYDEDIRYWKKKLENVPINKFTSDSGHWGDFEGASIPVEISAESIAEFRKICSENNCSVFTGLTAVVNILIRYYFGTERAAVGIAYSGRIIPEIRDVVGSFAVGSAIITEMSGEMNVNQLIVKTDKEMKETIEHAQLPFNVIVEKCGADRRYASLAYNFLVNCLDTDVTDGNKLFTGYRYSEKVVPADLILTAELSGSKNKISMLYRKNVFDPEDVSEWCMTIADIINMMISDPLTDIESICERLENE